MISDKEVQIYLRQNKLQIGPVDGFLGPKSYSGLVQILEKYKLPWNRWNKKRQLIALHQIMLHDANIQVGAIDGLLGELTKAGYEQWQNRNRDIDPSPQEVEHLPTMFPRYQDMEAFYGKIGENQTTLILPYPMKIAWNTKQTIRQFSIHEKCHDSAKRVFESSLEHYGLEGIKKLRLDYFGGCLNVRKMKGGSRWSVHSWGAAIDIDPIKNSLRMTSKQAQMAKPEYNKWWELWEAEGWISLGRERNYDWMHVQAARL